MPLWVAGRALNSQAVDGPPGQDVGRGHCVALGEGAEARSELQPSGQKRSFGGQPAKLGQSQDVALFIHAESSKVILSR